MYLYIRNGKPDLLSTSSASERIVCADDDNRPLLRLVHIPRNHYDESFATKAFAEWTKNLAWLRGTYGGCGITSWQNVAGHLAVIPPVCFKVLSIKTAVVLQCLN